MQSVYRKPLWCDPSNLHVDTYLLLLLCMIELHPSENHPINLNRSITPPLQRYETQPVGHVPRSNPTVGSNHRVRDYTCMHFIESMMGAIWVKLHKFPFSLF
jgi:hypothetical protein